MGLSTHVLDTMHGCPAAAMKVQLWAFKNDQYQLVKGFVLNADGRNPDGPLYSNESLQVGRYRLSFSVADYFKSKSVVLPDPAFLDVVHIDFGIAQTAQHYHVPLLCSPWSYSTYRGS
jgi:5-hydroxyisourate hydrolase